MLLAGCGRSPRGSQKPITHLSGLSIRFLDVGQGDAALIQWVGKSALVDGSPPDSQGKSLAALRRYQVSRLDWDVATHKHAAHIGGLVDPVRADLAQQPPPQGAAARDPLAPGGFPHRGGGPDHRPGRWLALFLFGPPAPFLQGTRDDVNNSLVARQMYGDTRILFAGDMEGEERRVLYSHLPDNFEAAKALRADALLMPDHGGAEGTDAELLQFVQPQVAVISCGAGNPAGNPQPGALAALRAAKVRTFRTDRQGEVTLVSDGKTLRASAAHAPKGDLWAPGKTGAGRVPED